jgi:hypothetical protein
MLSIIAEWKVNSEEIRPNIFISSKKHYPLFNQDVRLLLKSIEANSIGKRLLKKISLCTGEIYIHFGKENISRFINEKESGDAQIRSFTVISCSLEDNICYSTTAEEIPSPKCVILFHELVHAYHHLSGKLGTSNSCDPLVWESDEEYKTIVGFPSKKGKTTPKITENAFRREEGLPERFGSWSLSYKCGLAALRAARVTLVGSIHEKNQQADLENLNPPPMALCSISDLGSENTIVLLADIEGVDIDCTPKDKTSTFISIDKNNRIN